MLNYKEYVYAVYQERSFSKAAQKLYVSQPWLSSVVKKWSRKLKHRFLTVAPPLSP